MTCSLDVKWWEVVGDDLFTGCTLGEVVGDLFVGYKMSGPGCDFFVDCTVGEVVGDF